MKIKKYSEINESNENIRSVVKAALENMYMFGGMPKPDPRYDSYLNNMIDIIMKAIKDKYGEK